MSVAEPELGNIDQVLRFSVPSRNMRGRLVRLGPLAEAILAAHAYPPPIRQLLAEALVLTALLGALLKDEGGQLTMQAQTESGVVDLLVCDYRQGELRGYVRHDPARLDEIGPHPSLERLFGKGYLAITFDLATTSERYQGIVPLEGNSLAEACESYFAQSEQIPTLIRVAVQAPGGGSVAAGLLVQHLADGEQGRERLHVRLDHPDWEHVSTMAGSVRNEELTDPALPLDDLVWRLFHEEPEIRTEAPVALTRGCRCSVAHFTATLQKFPEEARAEMREEDGRIAVDCAFCSKVFRIET